MEPQRLQAHLAETLLHYAFSAIFFLTPLLFLPFNYELFEFNKMIFVYFMTSIIGLLWLLRIAHERKLTIVRTPLDIPLLLYLIANIITTIVSIDPHTSLFGYYSRFNGGLLSTIAYVFLYFAFTANVATKERLLSYLKVILYSTTIVSIFAILERLGIDKDYWVQDVQARVFSTFGQPNWLAAWLAMVIPFNLYFFFVSSTNKSKVTHFILLLINYLAFTFTYSRGGTLGLFIGLTVFGILFLYQRRTQLADAIKSLVPIGAAVLIVLILFGNALLRESKFNGLFRRPVQQQVQSDTQLATPGTESSEIRLIVWQGAWDIFKANPVFGTGVETFAYAYYQYRPAAHNQTTEWDFLYNKAHNEYLNELATKGLVGFVPYVLVIGTFLAIVIRSLVANPKSEYRNPKQTSNTKAQIAKPLRIWNIRTYDLFRVSNFVLRVLPADNQRNTKLFALAILASYISFLIQNIFGFSVVGISLLFFLLPAFFFVYHAQLTKQWEIRFVTRQLTNKFARIALYSMGSLLFLYAITMVARFWIADLYYAKGYNAIANGEAFDAYENLLQASYFNNSEPLYLSYLGYVAAQVAELAKDENEAELYQKFMEDAEVFTQNALATSSRNLTIVRNAAKTYTQLALLDEQYKEAALLYAEHSVVLSPTEPHDHLRYARILDYFDKTTEAEQSYKNAVDLKPDYKEARIAYAQFLANKATASEDQKNTSVLGAIDVLRYSLEHVASPDAEIEQLISSYSSQLQ